MIKKNNLLILGISVILVASQLYRVPDSRKIFTEFWELMDNHYAFFELREVNWQIQRETYGSKVSESTSEEDLLHILLEMIEPLQDGHTFIIYKGRKYRSGGNKPIWGQAGITKNLIKEKYLLDYQQRAGGAIGYGRITKAIGYIHIGAMEGYSASEIDQVLSALAGVESMIVDVRFNGGGIDQTSLDIAGRFADKRRFAYSKETYYQGKTNQHLDLYIEPQGKSRFSGKVMLLTNEATFSAAEMFVMAMITLPQCTSIGQNTAGAHSDVMQNTLSNGWTIGLSNQIYTMPDGKVYEMIGIPPDVPVKSDYSDSSDPILDKAIQLLNLDQ